MSHNIILPAGLGQLPSKVEMTAAGILVEFFEANIEFVPRGAGHTPDFKIKGVVWELKSPTGNGKHNIEHQFSRANKQSANLILDARRSKMNMARIRSLAIKQFRQSRTIKRLIIINKQSKVVEISKKP